MFFKNKANTQIPNAKIQKPNTKNQRLIGKQLQLLEKELLLVEYLIEGTIANPGNILTPYSEQ